MYDIPNMAQRKKEQSSKEKISENKERKVPSGPLKDKGRTIARLIATVGKVIRKYGYPGLTLANIGKESGVDRKLVYDYFGSVNNLIETYIKQKDFWRFGGQKAIEKMVEKPKQIGRDQIYGLLEGQFDTLFKDRSYQRIIHWELGEKRDLLRHIADTREETGERIFEIIESEFKAAEVDIRARLALQIGGIYYLILHARSNGSTVCGIDINEEKGRERIKKAIKDMVYEIYEKAGVDK